MVRITILTKGEISPADLPTRTDSAKCHVSHVVADTDTWEQKMAQVLEDLPEVVRYVKNHNLGFWIPYSLSGQEHRYFPDFIACLDDGRGPEDLLNLVLEVSGERKKDKAAKVAAARQLWLPAVNMPAPSAAGNSSISATPGIAWGRFWELSTDDESQALVQRA